jgi:hypothetical protein
LQQQIEVVASGGGPLNVAFETGAELVALEYGQFFS